MQSQRGHVNTENSQPRDFLNFSNIYELLIYFVAFTIIKWPIDALMLNHPGRKSLKVSVTFSVENATTR